MTTITTSKVTAKILYVKRPGGAWEAYGMVRAEEGLRRYLMKTVGVSGHAQTATDVADRMLAGRTVRFSDQNDGPASEWCVRDLSVTLL